MGVPTGVPDAVVSKQSGGVRLCGAVLPINSGSARPVNDNTVYFGDNGIGRSRVVDQQIAIGCRTQAVDGVGVIGLNIQGIAGQQRQAAGSVKQEQIIATW